MKARITEVMLLATVTIYDDAGQVVGKTPARVDERGQPVPITIFEARIPQIQAALGEALAAVQREVDKQAEASKPPALPVPPATRAPGTAEPTPQG